MLPSRMRLKFNKENLRRGWLAFSEKVDKHLWKIFLLWIISIVILFFITSEYYDLLYSKYPLIENTIIFIFGLMLVFMAAPLLPPILVFGMARRYIWGHRTNVVLAVLAIPLIMFWIIALFTLIFFFISTQYSGAIQTIDGARLWQAPVAPFPNWQNLYPWDTPEWNRYWSEYGGTRGLLNISYFSSQVLLGFSYGEYSPVGLAKPIVVLEALIGKILDIVLVSIGLSILLERNKQKSLTEINP